MTIWKDSPTDGSEPAARGLVFTVPDAVASLTARALARRLAAQVQVLTPLVFLDGSDEPGRTRVVVLTVSPNVRDALVGAREPHESILLDDLTEFLDHWADRTDMRLHAVSRTQVVLDFDRVPADSDRLVEDLVELGGHFFVSEDAARMAFKAALERHLVRLGS